MGAMNLELSEQQLREFKKQTIKDAKAIANELLLDDDTWGCDRT